MKKDVVVLIVKYGEEFLFERGRVFEEAEGLVAVSGDDDFVIVLDIFPGSVADDFDVVRAPADIEDGRFNPDPVLERGDQPLDIFPGTAVDGAPGVAGVEAEESVVVPELEEGEGGELQHFLWGRGPDCRTHGDEVSLEEVLAIAAGVHVFREGHSCPARVIDGGDGFGVESFQFQEEAPEAGIEEVPALSEDGIQIGPIPFQSGGAVMDAEGHGGGLGGDVQSFEKPGEQGVGDLVVDNEPGVDGHLAIVFVDVDGVGMSADVSSRFVDGDVVGRVKEVGATEARDAAPDDGDALHDHSPFVGRPSL